MLARKKQFFQKSAQYDEYSIFAATKVFMRLIDKRCYEDNPSMPLVKSCLNYIKKILYPYKVTWEQQNYSQLDLVDHPKVDSS